MTRSRLQIAIETGLSVLDVYAPSCGGPLALAAPLETSPEGAHEVEMQRGGGLTARGSGAAWQKVWPIRTTVFVRWL